MLEKKIIREIFLKWFKLIAENVRYFSGVIYKEEKLCNLLKKRCYFEDWNAELNIDTFENYKNYS